MGNTARMRTDRQRKINARTIAHLFLRRKNLSKALLGKRAQFLCSFQDNSLKFTTTTQTRCTYVLFGVNARNESSNEGARWTEIGYDTYIQKSICNMYVQSDMTCFYSSLQFIKYRAQWLVAPYTTTYTCTVVFGWRPTDKIFTIIFELWLPRATNRVGWQPLTIQFFACLLYDLVLKCIEN